MEKGNASPEGNASGAGGAASTAGREDEVVLGSVSMFGSLDRSWNVGLPKSLEAPVAGAPSQPRFPAMRNTFPWSCAALCVLPDKIRLSPEPKLPHPMNPCNYHNLLSIRSDSSVITVNNN